jgi:hypothetical protein
VEDGTDKTNGLFQIPMELRGIENSRNSALNPRTRKMLRLPYQGISRNSVPNHSVEKKKTLWNKKRNKLLELFSQAFRGRKHALNYFCWNRNCLF